MIDNFISTEGLEDTGLKDPIYGKPLYKVGIDPSNSDKITYVSERDGRDQQSYTKDKKEPYYSSNPYNRWSGTKRRFFVPNEDGSWTEYKSHFTWDENTPTIYLPADMPDDEVTNILEVINRNCGGFGRIMPMAAKVASRTIGMDLVAVTPMPGPKMSLLYLDFVYGGVKPLIKEVPKRKKIIRLLNKKKWNR